ncbi:MAG: hypothetical protein LBJ89_02725 [Holosporales bacterium]|nr:hypothetical protein [Holosporales bacterium]
MNKIATADSPNTAYWQRTFSTLAPLIVAHQSILPLIEATLKVQSGFLIA